jgi:hypothetical protein
MAYNVNFILGNEYVIQKIGFKIPNIISDLLCFSYIEYKPISYDSIKV